MRPKFSRHVTHRAAPDSVPGSGNGDAAQADATPCGGETKRRARLLHDLQSHDERSQQKRFSGQLYWQQYCKRLPLNNVKIGVTGEKGMGLYLQDAKGAGEELWREPPFAHMLTKGQLGKLCVYCCRAVGAHAGPLCAADPLERLPAPVDLFGCYAYALRILSCESPYESSSRRCPAPRSGAYTQCTEVCLDTRA